METTYSVKITLPAGSLVCFTDITEEEVTKVMTEYLGRMRTVTIIPLG